MLCNKVVVVSSSFKLHGARKIITLHFINLEEYHQSLYKIVSTALCRLASASYCHYDS